MLVQDNISTNLRWIQAFNERDWTTEGDCRALGFVAHVTGAPVALDGAGWMEFLSTFVSAFPDAQVSVESTIAERDVVASRWTMTGTHQGAFQGVPATGRQISMAGVEFSTVLDGRIVEHWAQFDVLAVLQQIGALPAPA